MRHAIPEWCRVRPGARPLLLVAPHGGRRPAVDAAAPPPNLRVNDLYTADLTEALATRLDAAAIINTAEDRNRLDLNRVSQTRRHARWFLELLAALLEDLVGRHGCAEVVFVHGWNDGQVKCDVGIGATGVDGRVLLPEGAALTVGAGYARQRLGALRAACAARGIAVGLGVKYPASHPNNVVQLFARGRAGGDDPLVHRLRSMAATGRVDAWQLELAIPLRWPGLRRERLLDALSAALGARVDAQEADDRGADTVSWGEDPPARAEPVERAGMPAAVQCYDPVADVGIVAGLGPTGPSTTGGRVLLFLGGQRVALFTGETPGGGRTRVAPLEIAAGADGVRVAFSGPLLVLSDAGLYVDLEAALAASTLVEATVHLTCGAAADRGVHVGRLQGTVRVADSERRVDAPAILNAAFGRGGDRHPQASVAAAFDADVGVVCRDGSPAEAVLALGPGAGVVTPFACTGSAVQLDGDRYTPARLRFETDGGGEVDARPLCRMPILRQHGGRYVRVTFGIAAVTWAGRDGFGLYEYAVPVGA